MTSENFTSTIIRPMAVAGLFYPERQDELSRMVEDFLLDSNAPEPRGDVVSAQRPPKALIVPHAGYIYSGQAAGAGFHAIRPWAKRYKRVVLWGPAHRVAINGVAVPSCTEFATPLGRIPLDVQTLAKLQTRKGVVVSDHAHAQEHSLEVQLPFLQKLLGTFSLVPLVVGNIQPEQVKEIMSGVWGEDDTLVVVSSDLSHYHDYASAQQLDQHTCHAIETLHDKAIGFEHACGCIAVRALLLMAHDLGLHPHTVSLCNSGDTAGDKSRVVGYGSWVFDYAKTQ